MCKAPDSKTREKQAVVKGYTTNYAIILGEECMLVWLCWDYQCRGKPRLWHEDSLPMP